MSKFLATSLILTALILGMGIGFFVSPQYTMLNKEKASMVDFGKADKYVDLRYVNAMISHHVVAMKLAEQVKSTSRRDDIKILANSILANEPKAIEELYEYKKSWYNDNSEVKVEDFTNLGSYDDNLDLRFLNALIAHHESGVEMVREIKMKSTRNEILNNANAVEDFLSKGIVALSGMRTTWYQTN